MKPGLVFLVVFALAGCGDGGNPRTQAATPTPRSTPPTVLVGTGTDVLPSKGQTCAEAIAELPAKTRENAACGRRMPTGRACRAAGRRLLSGHSTPRSVKRALRRHPGTTCLTSGNRFVPARKRP
jgi:hypothetical protein